MKIAPDVPQILLTELNRIDFKKVSLIKGVILSQLRSYYSNLPLKNPAKIYEKKEPKKVTADFDQDFLDLLNQYDWELVPNTVLNDMLQQLKKYIGGIVPAKKKKQ